MVLLLDLRLLLHPLAVVEAELAYSRGWKGDDSTTAKVHATSTRGVVLAANHLHRVQQFARLHLLLKLVLGQGCL